MAADLNRVYGEFQNELRPQSILVIQPAEETAFLTLESDAQRDIFIDAFWQRHAPAGIPGDAFRTRYYELLEEGVTKYRRNTDRYVVYVVNGEPVDIFDPDCGTLLQPIQVWHYRSMAATGASGDVFFYLPRGSIDYVLWQPLARGQVQAYEELLSFGGLVE